MSLDALRELSISIIQLSISHPLGLATLPPSTDIPFTPKEQRLLDLHRELDTLSREIVEARESSGFLERRRRILGEAGISETSLLEKLEVAQGDYFKALQDNANKDVISQSLLRVNPTLKTIHNARNTLNTTERNLYSPIARRDVLASQLLKVSEQYSNLEEELANLEAAVLNAMRENKQIYTDLEKLSTEYERAKLASLSPAEKEQLSALEEGIAEQRELREIARNVLQGLILDSGLNWAKNPELWDAMLMAGENVEWQ